MLDRDRIAPEEVRPLRRLEFDRLTELGAFEDERLELLHGVIVAMGPQTPRHAEVLDELNIFLVPALQGRARVRVRGPFAADDSEPQPDLAVIFPGKHWREHPASAFLIIEVTDGDGHKERDVKRSLYANAGVVEYWIFDVHSETLEAHRSPENGGYRDVWRFQRGDSVALAAFPDVILQVADFLP